MKMHCITTIMPVVGAALGEAVMLVSIVTVHENFTAEYTLVGMSEMGGTIRVWEPVLHGGTELVPNA